VSGNPYVRFFSFFGLQENPFAVSPDPRYLFMTPRIQEAWEAIEYGIRSREGIILLTGEAGTGKTSLIRRLLDWLRENRTPTAYIFNSHLESKHLYDFMLADFGVRPDPQWRGNALMCLGQWLPERCREGRVPVLIVDEAQGLPLHVLEEIRLLLNLETPQEKLLQIVLAGQPELAEKLNRPETRQLKQRISLRCKTAPLTPKEARDYIQARLDVAGAAGRLIFSPDAADAVHAYSRGIPRVMNLLCEHALIDAYAGNMRIVPARVVEDVAREFHFDRERYVPSIYSRTLEAPPYPNPDLVVPIAPVIAESSMPAVQARLPISAPPESPLPDLQQMPLPSSKATESRAALPLSGAVEPLPAMAAQHQADAVLPQSEAHAVPDPDASAMMLDPLIARQTTNKGATRIRKRKPPLSSHVLATLRDSWTQKPISPALKSRLLKRGYDFRRTLHRIWSDVTDERRLRRIKAAVESRSERGLRQLSAAFSGAKLAAEDRWRDAAPVWQRTRASLLRWFERPLRLRNVVVEPATQPVPSRRATRAKVASWPSVNRVQTRSRKQPQSVLPSNEGRMNVVVMRWLRQPFGGTSSTRSPRAAAGSRNR
jgi:type II secretory pathway predicted ATPase ExeA